MSPAELTNFLGLIALGSGGLFALLRYWSTGKQSRRSTTALTDSNLTDDQRELLAMLYKRDEASQARIDKLQTEVDRLRAMVEHLQSQLAAEMRMREASEARLAAEQGARQRLRISSTADEREITEMGDTAEKKYRDDNPEPPA